MRRVCYSTLLAVAIALPAAVAAQQPTFNTNKQVTFVMKGGERHTGTLVYHNSADFSLIENGQEKAYPASDIAVVDFGAGNPAAAELNQLPTGTPAELQRNMIVLKDGSVIHGKLYTIKENALTIDTSAGNRQDVDINNVNRLYMNAEGARSVFAAELNQSTVGTTGQAPTNVPAGAIQVDAARAWTDAGITVRKGDRIAFSTTGQVSIRQGGEMTGPDGIASEARTGAPSQQIGVGGLIGRVGTGTPFPIGSNTQPITMPANGRLYLGVNDAGASDNSGSFVVTIVR